MKHRITWTALLLTAAALFASCDSEELPIGTDSAETTASETVPAVPDVLLAGEGAPEYVIIRGDLADQAEIDAAIFLRKYMEMCGVKVKITTDWEGNGVSEYEIVVGETLRTAEQGNTFDPRSVGEEGYYAVLSGRRIYIGGGSPASVMGGVEAFLADHFGYAGDPETASPVTDVRIAADYARIVRQIEVSVDGRSLDDFVIAVNKNDTRAAAAAEKLQAVLYAESGIRLEIADRDQRGESPAVLFSDDAPSAEGSFELSVAGGDLVVRTDVEGGFARGIHQFLTENITDKTGTLALDASYTYTADIGHDVSYIQFGAAADGVTNDIAALIAAHDYANANNLPVRADEGATYYISAADKGAMIKTDTDWTGASFIIDDSGVTPDKRSVAIFNVIASKKSYSIADRLQTVAKGQTKLDLTFPEDSVIVLTNSGVKRYIREGKNANNGSEQQELIVVDKDGNIDPAAPVIWDYEKVTSATVIPMDETTLTVKGGTFTTIANKQTSADGYYTRGILVSRSNTVVDGIVHYVTGEGSQGAPYYGILVIQNCADITVQNCVFTGHKTYTQKKETGTVSKGTYDISPSRVINLTFRNCSQTTDILNTNYWGIMGSNFCKNIVVDGCTFSRFDAHQGVANVTILNSTLGHQCLNAIGSGTLRVENTTLYGTNLINLRSDYGSTWEGDVIIKDCTWIPNKGNKLTGTYAVISGSYSGFHDFGYECYMPANITIDGLYVDDSKASDDFKGIYLLRNIIPDYTSEEYEIRVQEEGYPYHITETLTIGNYSAASGKKWNLSTNMFMYRNVVIHDLDEK